MSLLSLKASAQRANILVTDPDLDEEFLSDMWSVKGFDESCYGKPQNQCMSHELLSLAMRTILDEMCFYMFMQTKCKSTNSTSNSISEHAVQCATSGYVFLFISICPVLS